MTASLRSAKSARTLLLVLTLGVVWACLPFIAGLLGAAVLTVVAAPVHRRLAPRIGERKAALALTIAALVLLGAPALVLVGFVLQQAPEVLRRTLESAAFARLGTLHVGPVDVGAQLTAAGHNAVAWASGTAIAAAGPITLIVLNLLIAMVGFYYLLPGGPALWERVRPLIPFSPAAADRLAERFASLTRAALLSIGGTAISQGLTVGLGFRIAGLPNPVFWGMATAMVSILPIFGSALVWVPGVAVLALNGRMGAAVTLGIIGFVFASNVDNLIMPIVFRRVSGVHPLTSLLGAFAGLKLLGIAGVLLGPLALTYCLELYALYEAEYAHSAAPSRWPEGEPGRS